MFTNNPVDATAHTRGSRGERRETMQPRRHAIESLGARAGIYAESTRKKRHTHRLCAQKKDADYYPRKDTHRLFTHRKQEVTLRTLSKSTFSITNR